MEIGPDREGVRKADRMTSSPILKAALAYAEMGFSPIPLKPRSKVPDLRRWQQYQNRLPTEEELRGWFDAAGERNLAVVCGEVSGGLFVLDFDDPQAFTYTFGEAEELASETLLVRTGGGGYHVYLRAKGGRTPKKTSLRRQAGKDRGPHLPVDVQGEKSYVVAPPSVHASGESYGWVGQRERILEVVPEETLQALQARAEEWPLVEVVLPSWLEGVRHGAALGFAAFLRKDLGWPEDRARRAVEGVCRLAGDGEVQDRLRAVEDTYRRPAEEISLEGLDPDALEELRRIAVPLKGGRGKRRAGTPAPPGAGDGSLALLRPEGEHEPWSEAVLEEARRLDYGRAKELVARVLRFPRKSDYDGFLLSVGQTYVVVLLEKVWYLALVGPKSSGKTTATKVWAWLGDGTYHVATVSAAALVAIMEAARGLTIDEVDATLRRPERDLIEALLRQGIEKGQPYVKMMEVRREGRRVHEPVAVPTFGPKAFNYRGKLEDALTSRADIVEMVRAHDAGLRRRARRYSELLAPLKAWLEREAARALAEWTPEKVRAYEESDEFVALSDGLRVELDRTGEVGDLMLLVGKILRWPVEGVVQERLDVMGEALEDEGVEEVREAILELVEQAGGGDDGEVKIPKQEVKARIDLQRMDRGGRSVSYNTLAGAYREIGLRREGQRGHGDRRRYLVIGEEELRRLHGPRSGETLETLRPGGEPVSSLAGSHPGLTRPPSGETPSFVPGPGVGVSASQLSKQSPRRKDGGDSPQQHPDYMVALERVRDIRRYDPERPVSWILQELEKELRAKGHEPDLEQMRAGAEGARRATGEEEGGGRA